MTKIGEVKVILVFNEDSGVWLAPRTQHESTAPCRTQRLGVLATGDTQML